MNEIIGFFRELTRDIDPKTKRLLKVFAMLIAVCLVLTCVGKFRRAAADRRTAPELAAFDEWAGEALDIGIAYRELVSSTDIENYGAYSDPAYKEVLKEIAMLEELQDIADADRAVRKAMHKDLRVSLEELVGLMEKGEGTLTPGDSVTVGLRVDQLKYMEKMLGPTVPDDVMSEIGLRLHRAQVDLSDIARGEGRMLEYAVRAEGEDKIRHLLFVSPRDVLAIRYYTEIF